MSEDRFTKLFKYVEKRFDTIEKKVEEKSSQDSVERLTDTVDNFIKRLDTYEVEQVSRDRQFDRLVAWAKKVSKKTGIPLENL